MLQHCLAKQLGHHRLKSIDLPFMLELTKPLESTDPRDKIYALLGVDEVKDIILVPDYTKSISQVYTEFKYIRTEQDLSIVCEGGIGILRVEPLLELPSWVPDFRPNIKKGQ